MRKLSLESIVKFLLSLAASASLAACAYVMLSRMAYPFELEWMEGGSLVHVWRILNGLPLYTPPSIDFMPFIYQPFYYVVSAFFALFTGFSFLPLRLVSSLSTLLVIILLYRFTTRETGDRWLGVIAAGLFAGTFRLVGAWFDIARVDMLCTALFLLGAYLSRSTQSGSRSTQSGSRSTQSGSRSTQSGSRSTQPGPRFPVKGSLYLVPVLFTLAYFTKQPILLPIAAVLLWQVLTRRPGAWRMVLIFAGLTLAVTLVLHLLTDGWYTYYTYTLAGQHRLIPTPERAINRLLNTLYQFYPLLLLSIPYFIASYLRKAYTAGLFYAALLSSLGLLAYISRLNPGGYDNVFIQFAAGAALTGALGLGVMFKNLASLSTAPRIKQAPVLLGALAAVLLTLKQFNAGRFDIAAQIPTPADRAAGEALLEALAVVDGEVYNPSFSYLNLFIGKPAYTHTISLWEFEGRFSIPTPNNLRQELTEAAQAGRFAGILDDSQHTLLFDVPAVFNETHPLGEGDLFMPVTGWDNRPETLYLRTHP